MIDPRIFATNVPNVGQSIQIFNDTLRLNEQLAASRQNRAFNDEAQPLKLDLLKAQTKGADANASLMGQQAVQARDARRLASIAQFSQSTLLPMLKTGDYAGLDQILQQRIAELDADPNTDSTETREALQMLRSGNLQGLEQSAIAAVDMFTRQSSPKEAVTKSYAPMQIGDQMYIPTFNPNTGEARNIPVQGGRVPTSEERLQSEVKGTMAIQQAKGKADRANQMKAQLGERNRNAANSSRTLAEALKLVENADQGIQGGVKLQLARLLPGIDTSDEGALDSALNRLALEQLQSFKGPTTDFEFGVTQDIVGRLSDPREANRARLKSLQRANWFNKEEYNQFNNHISKGGDPDAFSFNFDKPVTLGGQDYTLRQLQDTAVHYNLSIEEVMERLNAANN